MLTGSKVSGIYTDQSGKSAVLKSKSTSYFVPFIQIDKLAGMLLRGFLASDSSLQLVRVHNATPHLSIRSWFEEKS